ncbi:MAG: tryptophan synthase subunit alpha [Candidatus Omnitrophica bacterium]|nr:tryptophan synthase subunit alpha [Candidatus Omnitrophota bacterium]
MKNRIQSKFKALKKHKHKALIAYIMAGDPSIGMTEKIVLSLEKCGVDLIELGVPFSDPLADGPTIQAADTRTLKKGINIENVFALSKKLRKRTQIPLILMIYYNLILNVGEERFTRLASASGIDGLIVPDLPPEEARNLIKCCRRFNLATIFFVAPTSSTKRIRSAVSNSTGFIYYISRTGVTGKKTEIGYELNKQIKKIKKLTKKPICVGFGIRTREQVRMIKEIADGVIVGSAIVDVISRYSRDKQILDKVEGFLGRLDV